MCEQTCHGPDSWRDLFSWDRADIRPSLARIHLDSTRIPFWLYVMHYSIGCICLCNAFIGINITFIHSGCFYSASSSPLVLRGTPHYSIDIVSELTHQKRYRQLWVKDLHKVPTWRLERDSNLRMQGSELTTETPRPTSLRLTAERPSPTSLMSHSTKTTISKIILNS